MALQWLGELTVLRLIRILEKEGDAMTKMEEIQAAAKDCSDSVDALIAAHAADMSVTDAAQTIALFNTITSKAKGALTPVTDTP